MQRLNRSGQRLPQVMIRPPAERIMFMQGLPQQKLGLMPAVPQQQPWRRTLQRQIHTLAI
jgi:hypothetical protein